MTDPVTLGVAAVAAGVAMLAGHYAMPRAPSLDPERWFKTLLATALRGEVEVGGGDAGAWERAVLRWVPYHPAGRLPELKVTVPERFPFPEGRALDGERGLVEALAALRGLDQRWARLYDDDESAVRVRLEDPVALGGMYDPATWLGPSASWDALATWEPFAAALTARARERWVIVGAGPVGERIAQALPGRCLLAPADGDPDVAAKALVDRLHETVTDPSERLVLFGEGEGAHVAVRAMAADAGLRDVVVAVISVGGALLGTPTKDDWMGHHFAHDVMDTEIARKTPWISVQWLDRACEPPGVPGLPLEHQRFPPPGGEPAKDWGIDPLDLGPLSAVPDLPVRAVARALVAFATCWIASRR